MNESKSDNNSRILIQNEKFNTENSPTLVQHGVGGCFSKISFTNCNFDNVSLPGPVLACATLKIAYLTPFSMPKVRLQVVVLKVAK